MKLRTSLFFVLGLAAMSPVYAADMKESAEDRAEVRYDATKDIVKKNYEMAKEDCKALAGDAKDVCLRRGQVPGQGG